MNPFEAVLSGDIPALLSSSPLPSSSPPSSSPPPSSPPSSSSINLASLQPYLPFLVGFIVHDTYTAGPSSSSSSSSPSNDIIIGSVYDILANFPITNDIIAYYKLPFDDIRRDMTEEAASRSKLNETPPEGIDNTASRFELGSTSERLMIVLDEVLRLVFHVQTKPHERYTTSMILSNKVYLTELAIILPISRKYDTFGVSPVSVALALITCPHGPPLIHSMILNHPPFLYDILGPLLDSYMTHKEWIANKTNAMNISSSLPSIPDVDVQNSSSYIFIENLNHLLLYLSSLSFPVACHIRSLLLERNILPSIILTITTKHINDTYLFLSSIVLSGQPHKYQWLKEYIDAENNDQTGAHQGRIGYSELRAALRHDLSRAPRHRVASHLKLYAGLAGLVGFTLGEEEAELVLSKLTSTDQKNNTITQVNGVCLLLLWQGLLSVISATMKQSVGAVLKQIINQTDANNNDGLAQGLLVLLGAHFQTHSHTVQTITGSPHASVAGVVRSVLGLPVAIHGESLSQFATTFADSLLIPPSLPFQLALQHHYNIHPQTHMLCLSSVHQLLKSGVIPASIPVLSSNSTVDLTMWMWTLITQLNMKSNNNSTFRLPPLLPAIITLVVECAETQNPTKDLRVPEVEVRKCLMPGPVGSEDYIGPVHVLALYYVLLHNEKVVKQRNATANSNIPSTILKLVASATVTCEYSNEMLGEVPVRATSVQSLWFSIFELTPWTLSLRTVHALWSLQDSNSTSSTRGHLAGKPTHSDLVVDPLLVLRVDKRVWCIPALVQILLQILSSYMAASRRAIQSRTLSSTSTGMSIASGNDMECTALMMAQDSAAIQILLEAVHLYIIDTPNIDEVRHSEKPAYFVPTKGMITESITNVCMFIHQMFIAQPLLAKLVHFQGYPHTLIPRTVAHVPSMHICLDFILELLSHSHQPEKLLFAINLASYLVAKYPLPHTLPIAKRALQLLPHLHTLYARNDTAQGGHNAQAIENIVENVGRICGAFPVLAEDALVILLDMAAASRSRDEFMQIQLATKSLKSVVGLSNAAA